VPVYTITQVNQYLRQLLDQDLLLSELWISGEVSNLTTSQAGHVYFTLKDPQSQLRCVMFSGSRGMGLLSNGAAVTAHGRVSFYEARSLIELRADLVMAEGVGPLALEYERLKGALEDEGLFDPSRKRPLPRFPKTIGVVTSPTGAVFHDICKVLTGRYPLVEVLLAPTLVQGEEAASGIQKALKALNDDARADLIILARGGGSLEELWPFNEESVARAIYASRIPIISAVGHERDYTIADYVADARSPTPSAAAEMAVPDRMALQQETTALRDRLSWSLSSHLTAKGHSLALLVSQFNSHAPDVDTLRRRVDDLSHQASTSYSGRMSLLKQQVATTEMHLQALSPTATLHRGYAVVQKESSGEVVSRRAQVKASEELKVTVSDGAFGAVANGTRRRRRRKEAIVYANQRLFP